MPKNDQNEESTSILAKVGNFLGRGAKALGWGIIYPIWPKNWFKSWNEIGHDIKNGWHSVIKELHKEKEYDPPIETTQASKDLGVEIKKQEKGKVSFLASRTLTGDIPYLSPEQLDKIKKDLPNVTIFREENKIVIEIDVEKIIKKIKNDNPEINEKAIKELALKEIFNKVDCNLKGLAKITGGEFKIHTDLKLLNGIAEKFYKEYDNQKQSSEATKPSGLTSSEGLLKAGQPSETIASGEKKWAQESIKPGKSQSCGMQK
ncbi:hypothetical protein [Wolbachia endosymbiont (group A) of Ennomos erosarius]|uniref:hypothetical protein n=1 Tax=Wolbachia endosymbiont (group A) of Ennomos erosarius TaxID=3066174 RepID=UPI0033412A3E